MKQFSFGLPMWKIAELSEKLSEMTDCEIIEKNSSMSSTLSSPNQPHLPNLFVSFFWITAVNWLLLEELDSGEEPGEFFDLFLSPLVWFLESSLVNWSEKMVFVGFIHLWYHLLKREALIILI